MKIATLQFLSILVARSFTLSYFKLVTEIYPRKVFSKDEDS